MKIKINRCFQIKILFWMFVTGIMIKPPCIEEMGFIVLDMIYDISKVIISTIIIFLFIIRSVYQRKIAVFVICSSSYVVARIISTIIHDGDIFKAIIYGVPLIVFSIIMTWAVNNKYILDGVYAILALYSIINFVVCVAYPDGLYITQNGWNYNYFLGYKQGIILYMLPLIAIALFYYDISKNAIHILVALIAVIQPYLESSVSATIAMIIACIFICDYIHNGFIYHLVGTPINSLLLFIFGNYAVTYTDLYLHFSKLFSIFGRNADMTGRILFWKLCREIIKNHFFLGIGLMDGAKLKRLIFATHAHNFMLDILLTSGIVGLICFCSMLVLIAKKNGQNHINIVSLQFCFLMLFFIAGMAEAFQNIGAMTILFGLLFYAKDYMCLIDGEVNNG